MHRVLRINRRALLAGVPYTLLGKANRGLRITQMDGERAVFAFGDIPLLEYRYAGRLPKPYVHPFYAPNGAALTLDSPFDHKHHRGVMIGWTDINGYDFWGEPESTRGPHGVVAHKRVESVRGGELTAIEHWEAGGQLLLVERRTLRAHAPGKEIRTLDWESELRPGRLAVTLKAHKLQFDGLGIRFARKMDGGETLNSEGTRLLKQVNGQPAFWCAYCGEWESGGAGSVAIFDHPSNPRHPTPFFVMNQPFGYLSAAPTFHAPLALSPGQMLSFRYRVVALTGRPNKARLDRLYQAWKSTSC